MDFHPKFKMIRLLFLILFLLFSCEQKSPRELTIKKCVVTKVSVIKKHTTIDSGVRFFFYTDCGNIITNKKGIYNVGDTIEVVH